LIAADAGVTEAGRDESPLRVAFLASMAGLEAFSQQAARELAPYGVRVYAVKSNTDVESVLELCKEM